MKDQTVYYISQCIILSQFVFLSSDEPVLYVETMTDIQKCHFHLYSRVFYLITVPLRSYASVCCSIVLTKSLNKVSYLFFFFLTRLCTSYEDGL